MYPHFKLENFKYAVILLYNPLKNTEYFCFGFDQVDRNHKE